MLDNRHRSFILCLLSVACILLISSGLPQKVLKVTYPRAADSSVYTFFAQENLVMSFEIQRPQKKEQDVLICIPAAFTTEKLSIDGFHMKDGISYNRKGVNHGVGGACIITKGKCKLIATDKGKIFSDSFVTALQNKKASCFQQILIVQDGKAASFKDQSLFQRRAIITKKDGSTFIVQSSKPVTLKKFSEDLAWLGAWNALYTDMGAWDEGWFRDEKNQPVTIGDIRTETEKQTNWVTFRIPKKTK